MIEKGKLINIMSIKNRDCSNKPGIRLDFVTLNNEKISRTYNVPKNSNSKKSKFLQDMHDIRVNLSDEQLNNLEILVSALEDNLIDKIFFLDTKPSGKIGYPKNITSYSMA